MNPPTAKWIDFIETTPPAIKTKRYSVLSKEKHYLGEIKWYGPFRKYSFFPQSGTVFEIQCMTDIINFIKFLTEKRLVQKRSYK